MNLLYKIAILTALSAFAFGGVKEFDEIKDKPKGLAKDYYIYRLLNEGRYTKEQIETLSRDVYRRSPTLSKVLDPVVPPVKAVSECGGVKGILSASTQCQKRLLTIAFSLKLTADTRAKLAIKFDDINATTAARLRALNAKFPADEFAKINDADAFLAYYNAVSNRQNFERNFNAEFINQIATKKAFEKIASDLVIEKKLPNFRRNFLNINPENVSDLVAFTLGINAILFDDERTAFSFFAKAAETAKKQHDKDEATFWCYLTTKDEIFLQNLNESSDINIYTLYANELTNTPFPKVFSPTAERESIEDYDIKDPFLWQQTFKFIKDINSTQAAQYAPSFKTKETLGHYAYFMEKASGYKDAYFVMPFADEFPDINASRKALIYALGKQESRFIPSVISTSYALGMMQFMPFLANAIGKKELKIPNFDQDDMFDPRIAIKFANHHLNYLEKFLYHPLFIAYAYNGGIGFTKRTLQRGDLFNEGKYEPFLSLELIPYAESRLYGKKVLANFVIYAQLLNSNTSILQLFEILKKPHLTDKFRN